MFTCAFNRDCTESPLISLDAPLFKIKNIRKRRFILSSLVVFMFTFDSLFSNFYFQIIHVLLLHFYTISLPLLPFLHLKSRTATLFLKGYFIKYLFKSIDLKI